MGVFRCREGIFQIIDGLFLLADSPAFFERKSPSIRRNAEKKPATKNKVETNATDPLRTSEKVKRHQPRILPGQDNGKKGDEKGDEEVDFKWIG